METETLEIDRDIAEALQMLGAKPPDPVALLRARERAECIRQEMLKKYGVREIAVELIRAIRDAE